MNEFEVPEQIVCLQWRSDETLAPTFNYFHLTCYAGQAERLPGASIRYLPIQEVGHSAICSGCWKYIREQEES